MSSKNKPKTARTEYTTLDPDSGDRYTAKPTKWPFKRLSQADSSQYPFVSNPFAIIRGEHLLISTDLPK